MDNIEIGPEIDRVKEMEHLEKCINTIKFSIAN